MVNTRAMAIQTTRKYRPVPVGQLLINGIMLLFLAVSMIPLIWVIRTAFIPKDLALDLTALALPTLDNFKRVLAAAPFGKYYGNTIFITAGVLLGTLIVRQTMKTIPYELEEAAKMDGANLFEILWKVYVPLLKPAYVSFGMISASFQWNNFLWPLVMTDSVEKRPLSLGLAMFAMSYETGVQWSDVSAATVLVCAPLLILFFVFQRQFMESAGRIRFCTLFMTIECSQSVHSIVCALFYSVDSAKTDRYNSSRVKSKERFGRRNWKENTI